MGDVLALNLFLQVMQLSVSATGGPDIEPGAGPKPPCSTHLQDFPARWSSLFIPLHSCCLWDNAVQLSSSHVSGLYCDLNFPLQVVHIGGRLILGLEVPSSSAGLGVFVSTGLRLGLTPCSVSSTSSTALCAVS